MRPDLATTTARVTDLCERLPHVTSHPTLLQQVDNALCEGYALALSADAWSNRTQQQLDELINEASFPLRARELRTRATEHANVQIELMELRRELVELRRQRDRLRARLTAA